MGSSSFKWPLIFLSLVGLCYAPRLYAHASLTGQTGLVHMPDARLEAEGVWRFGVSNSDPYFTGWSSISVLPRLELSGRFTRLDNVPAFADGSAYGDYKDKAFDAKLLLRRESPYVPAIGFGVQDFTGTGLFRARYLTLSKQFTDVDLTLGYGEQRIGGWFGGLRYTPAGNQAFSLVLEYDANRYDADFRADVSGAQNRRGGTTFGIEYRRGWVGTQWSLQDGAVSGQLYVSIPLMKREFIPKIDEPGPPAYMPAAGADGAASMPELVRALRAQGFAHVSAQADDNTVRVRLTHPRITVVGRAVGRAVRTTLALDAQDNREIEITYTLSDLPALTYKFSDRELLHRYFRNEISLHELERSTAITFATPESARQARAEPLQFDDQAAAPAAATTHEDTKPPALDPSRESLFSGFSLVPFNLRFFFNDPSGAFHHDAFSTVNYEKRLAPGLFLDGAARITLFEDVSEVTQVSNSRLPHVRTDVAEYRRAGDRLRLESLLLNRYAQLYERLYARFSAGYYEEMFGGVGGQVLYLPARGEWAADLSIDWLKQRQPGESFGFGDYTVLTAVSALHYRFPARGITATARIGRFLAGDEGVRLELKRRFRSGVEMGAWYTLTNKDDVTGPGTPQDPYRDKGIFLSIPLNTLLTRDTQQRAEFSLRDFTRDVGQLVESPRDLYLQFERGLLLNSSEHGALTDLAK